MITKDITLDEISKSLLIDSILFSLIAIATLILGFYHPLVLVVVIPYIIQIRGDIKLWYEIRTDTKTFLHVQDILLQLDDEIYDSHGDEIEQAVHSSIRRIENGMTVEESLGRLKSDLHLIANKGQDEI